MTVHETATRADYTALAGFLAHRSMPPGTLNFQQLKGFLFAIVTSPEAIDSSEWIPQIFDQAEPEFTDVEQSRAVFAALMELYNETNDGVLSGHPVLPPDCALADAVLANCDPDSGVARWAQGFARGHDWLLEVWAGNVPEEREQEYDYNVYCLRFFSSFENVRRDFARGRRARGVDAEALFEREAARVCRDFSTALAAHAALGRMLHEFNLALDAQREPVRSARIGRNAPCPCGSGKKYKRCCGGVAS